MVHAILGKVLLALAMAQVFTALHVYFLETVKRLKQLSMRTLVSSFAYFLDSRSFSCRTRSVCRS